MLLVCTYQEIIENVISILTKKESTTEENVSNRNENQILHKIVEVFYSLHNTRSKIFEMATWIYIARDGNNKRHSGKS